ncbi:hypothetical protein DPMN_055767 [Dreissena polymorpha]|uniref:G-protein coupled receptors family 1 profile domain-containing protein n=1 Tax=Dreissena polymorpha TaxID=45954 RepID=A0A9D4HSK2_DREPO|nr:hypothetical protein DPMN_055767 [Dreissena polymorpha]
MTTNVTLDAQSRLNASSWSVYLSLCVVWIPGIVCNLIALVFIIRDIRKLVFPALFLLLILVCCDLTAIVFASAQHILLHLYNSVVTYPSCVFLSSNSIFFRVASGVMNLIMAVDRYLAICKPFYYKINVSVKTWKRLCFISGLLVVVFCCFPMMGLGYVDFIKRNEIVICSNLGYRQKPTHRIFGLIFPFIGFLCTLTIVVCNVRVIRALVHLRNRVVSIPSSKRSNSTDTISEDSRKVTPFEVAFAKLMACLAVVYLVCEAPYHVSNLRM